MSFNRLTTTGAAGLAAISDDGRYVAYVVTEGGKSGLWLRQVATTSNVPSVPAADVRFNGVTFAPDGNYVYYSFYPEGELQGSLWQVPVLGGVARRVLEVDAARRPLQGFTVKASPFPTGFAPWLPAAP